MRSFAQGCVLVLIPLVEQHTTSRHLQFMVVSALGYVCTMACVPDTLETYFAYLTMLIPALTGPPSLCI